MGYFLFAITLCLGGGKVSVKFDQTEWASLLSGLEACYLKKWCTCNNYGHIYDVWLAVKKNGFMVQKQVIITDNSLEKMKQGDILNVMICRDFFD